MGHRSPQRLGELELVVLDHLWSQAPTTVKEMHRVVGAPRGITSNTVQSTLERLFRKGLAERRKVGRAFEYRAALSRQEWVSRLLEGLAATVVDAGAGVLLSAFVDLTERTGMDQLEELERLVRERRRRAEDRQE